jgi:Tol biopolymer transport system component
MTRPKLLLVIGCAASLLVIIARVRAAMDAPRLTWIATAHQSGPVGYRDPAGAISPDGRSIAYSEGRFLRVRPIGGGAGVDFTPANGQIRTLVWNPDGKRIAADGFGGPSNWGEYSIETGSVTPLEVPGADGFRQPAWSSDGRLLAVVANGPATNELHTLEGDAHRKAAIGARITFPAFSATGSIACVATENGRSRVTLPCGGPPLAQHPAANAFGPLAFSPDGSQVYVSLANSTGTVDLWSIPATAGQRGGARQLTTFSRDSYAPSVAVDGSVVFKVQNYRTHVALAAATGGATRALATFQSETPSWDPTGKWLGITYGTWRRVPDDAKYPDIAQDAGIIAVDPAHPAVAPATVVHDSVSEDQSLCWSPNGQWIAFHSHQDLSDDIWLRRASGDPTARRISMLGRGAEAGWPRWSADGQWLLFTAVGKQSRRPAIYVIGIDQDSGAIREPAREVVLDGAALDVFHAEWIDAGASIAAIGREAPGRHVIFTTTRDGHAGATVYRFASEHDTPGLGVSPDGRTAAFIAPAPDGFFQVFRIPLSGGAPAQLTTDPSNKTQPAWSPDGERIAFTVWSYDAQFWRLEK